MDAFKKYITLIFIGSMLMLVARQSFAQPAGCPTGTITNVTTPVDCSTAATVSAPQVSTTSINTPSGTNNVTTYDGLTVNIRQYTTINSNASTVGVASGSTVTNSGTLNAGNLNNGYGISFGANTRSWYGGNTVVNTSSGEINTVGPNADGIAVIAKLATSTGNTISNYGRISTIGNGSYGISLDSRATSTSVVNTILNAGSITTTGNASASSTADGIYVNDVRKIVSITNTSTGSIQVTGAGANAITVNGAASIANSGLISSSSGLAISFTGSVPAGAFNSLTINNGSSIVGGIAFNAGSTQETLTFNGYSNNNFSNVISGLNVINATNGTNVTMNSSTAYELVSGKVAVDGTSSLNIAGVIQDQSSPTVVASSIEKTGSGTLTLSGANTYTGGTTVTGGTLAGNTTSLQGAITNNSIVNFNQATAGTYSGLMSGTGALLKTGDGNLTLTGHNTYSGGTMVSVGTLTGDNLSLQGNITNNATVNFNQLSVGTYSGVMSGTGSLLKTGGGTLTLSGANTYSGGTTVSAGTLSGNATSIQGNIVNNGTVQFSQSGTGTYSGTMSGSGNLTQVGNGVLNLTGPNTYSGGTNLNAGAIAVGNNTALGSGDLVMSSGTTVQASSSVNLANNISTSTVANIDTNGNNLELSGVISGSSVLNKNGAGALSIAGVNTYSGDTNINDGNLILTGTIGQSGATAMTTVASGASLQGNGIINGNLTNAGTIAPSFNGAQANLTVNGNYVGAGGNFVSNVYAPVTNPVADTMTISGGASGSTGVTIVDKGGLGNRTTGNGIAVVNVNGSSSTNAFALNQRVASGAFEYKLVKGTAAGTGNSWYLRTDNSSEPAAASEPIAPLLTPAVGERVEVSVYPALPSLVQLYAQTAVDTLDQRRGDLNLIDPDAGTKKKSKEWARIIGKTGSSTPTSSSNGPNLNFNAYAMQLGLDLYQDEQQGGSRTYIGPYVTIGSANGSTSNQGGATSTGNINGLQAYSAGLYATYFASNGLYVDALAQGSRYLNANASSVQGASMRTQGSGFTGSLEGGGRWSVSDKFLISPQAQVVYDAIGMNNSSDAYGQINFNKSELTRGRLGLLVGHKDVVGNTPIFAYLRASYWNVFNPGTSTTMASLYGVNQVTFQSQIGSRWMTVDGELNAKVTKDTNLFLNLAIENSLMGTYQAYSGRVGLQTRF